MNLQRIFLTLVILASALICSFGSVFVKNVHAQAVYKHTDESGRVSYSNQPRKGAVAVDLAPLTMMQGVPVAKVDKPKQIPTSEPVSPVLAPVPTLATPTSAPVTSAVPSPVARVLPVPASEGVSLKSATSLPSTALAGGISAAAMAKQRRDDVRRRIVEGEIEAEEQLFTEARDALAAEQARSPAMRMLRSSLPNETRPSETTMESRALIERHFARVRDLQDHVMMHEQNLRELREMLVGVANATSVRAPTIQSVPAATAAPLANSPKRETAINPAKVATVSSTPSPKRDRNVKTTTSSIATSTIAPNPKATISASTPTLDEVDTRAVSQLPVVKLRPASNNAVNSVVASLPKRSLAEDR
jgi:hypothetical protein